MLAAWRVVARLIGPLLAMRLIARRRAEGVAPARLKEFRGRASRPRPDGTLVWFHAASVGESLSLLPLIAAMQAARPGVQVLVTTITATSARLMAERLPEGAFHQFAPLDAPQYLRRFLAHWQPGLMVVVESELWPNMLQAVDRAAIPRALVNARLSAAALRNWARFPATARALLEPFAIASAQTAEGAEALTHLGARARVGADLKAAALPPPADPDELARIEHDLANRPVWAAISTHEGEEREILAAHDVVRRTLPDALLILCPRHPERADAIARLAPMTRRSLGEGPEGAIWLVDTLGETGLWYRLASPCFIGGSLVAAGGHNPWEAAQLGRAILHGPLVTNAASAYARLDASGAGREVTVDTLGPVVAQLLASAETRAEMERAAIDTANKQANPVNELAHELLALIPERR